MIHFRLRRSLRLAVDHLSSHLAASLLVSRFFHLPLRGTSAAAPQIFHHPVLPSLALSRLSRSILHKLPRFSRRVHPLTRRYLASSALLLALSLEICGCNPAESNRLVLDGTLVAATLSPPEPSLSFYDPPEPSTEASSPLLAVSDLPLDPPSSPIQARPVPWAISESVYFIYKSRTDQHPDGVRQHQPPVATAFVVSVPDQTHRRFDRFLVTARHVVDPQWADCSEQNPASIDLRLNRRNGGVGYETIPLQSAAGRLFYTSTDLTADLAVIPLNESLIPNLTEYKLIDVPFRLLPTNSELRLIRAGQPVMTAKPSGGPGSYPVFESGFLSKMPADSIGVRCGLSPDPRSPAKQLHVWFISAGVPRGVSGAPIFASIARAPGPSESPILIGVQSIGWPDKGIAGITPSSALGDLIQSTLRNSKLHPDLYRGPNP